MKALRHTFSSHVVPRGWAGWCVWVWYTKLSRVRNKRLPIMATQGPRGRGKRPEEGFSRMPTNGSAQVADLSNFGVFLHLASTTENGSSHRQASCHRLLELGYTAPTHSVLCILKQGSSGQIRPPLRSVNVQETCCLS